MLTTTTTTFLLTLTPLLALSTPTPQPSPQEPYIGLSIYQGSVTEPCASSSLVFNLKPPVAWLSTPPTSHCLPGVPGDIHNVTCITRRLVALPGDNAASFDGKAADMANCDFWGYTERNCTGKYWVAGKNDPLAAAGVDKAELQQRQSWIWTEEEREAGPDLLDIGSWQIACHA